MVDGGELHSLELLGVFAHFFKSLSRSQTYSHSTPLVESSALRMTSSRRIILLATAVVRALRVLRRDIVPLKLAYMLCDRL